MSNDNPKKSTFRSFVKLLISYQKFGVVIGLIITITSSLLDTAALALVVPAIELLIGMASEDSIVNSAHSASNIILDFTQRTFSFLGMTYSLKWMLITIFIVMGLRAVSVFLYNALMNYFKTGIVASISQKLYLKLEKSNWVFYKSNSRSKMTNLLTAQPMRVGSAYVDVTQVLSNAFNVLVYLIVGTIISIKLTFFAILSAFILTVVFSFLRIIARRLGEKDTIFSADLLESVGNSISMAKYIRSHGLFKLMRKNFFLQLNKVRKNQFLSAINEGVFHATYEYAFVILILSGLLVATKFLDFPASLVLLMSLLLYRIFQKVKVMQDHLQRLSKNLPALDAIEDAMDSADKEEEIWGVKEYKGFNKVISLKEIQVTLGDNQILKKLSLDINKNSIVAFIGPSGGGKTTIADVVSGLIRPDQGKVLIDKEDLYRFSENSWKNNLAYVSQSSLFFNDSIKNNLTWGNSSLTEEEIIEVSKKVSSHNFVDGMPDKYETNVGDLGSRLSGGERQRLVLARALLRHPEILILDEATSELDPLTQSEIVSTLDKLKDKMTILIIAHRLETIGIADKVYFVESGNISEILDPLDTINKESKMKSLFMSGNENLN